MNTHLIHTFPYEYDIEGSLVPDKFDLYATRQLNLQCGRSIFTSQAALLHRQVTS